MVGSTPIRILWLDDELVGERRSYVSVWLEWFEAEGRKLGAETKAAATLNEWVAALKEPGLKFDLLVLDVMLKREPETNFGLLGFADERILRLDAGAQIAGLLRNSQFSKRRESWLEAYSKVPIILLSSTTIVGELAKQYVDEDKSHDVCVVVKNLVVVDGAARADSEFANAMRSKIELVAKDRGHRP